MTVWESIEQEDLAKWQEWKLLAAGKKIPFTPTPTLPPQGGGGYRKYSFLLLVLTANRFPFLSLEKGKPCLTH
jgi:hypothetical protein